MDTLRSARSTAFPPLTRRRILDDVPTALGFIFNYVDRTSVGFAGLTMNRDQ
jgi:hypothetical protein